MAGITDGWFDSEQVFVGGVWSDAVCRQFVELENPSNGDRIARIPRCSAEDVDRAIRAARSACNGKWSRLTAAERGRILSRIGKSVERRTESLAKLESIDVGKPLSQARADAGALARYMEFYGGAADKLHGETIPYQEGFSVLTVREPFGVVGHIIPWNYPMQIIGRSVGAALASGNACVLKPSEEACLTALAFAAIAKEAGLPDGALNVVTGLGREAGAALASHADVNLLSFTGSLETGRRIQSAAAQNVVPVTLELGGKSPQIVFADANLDAALPHLVKAGIQNAGQTCSASSRILVEREVLDAVLARMAERYRSLVAGSALSDLDLGPLVSARQVSLVSEYLAQDTGLEVIARGSIDPGAPAKGHYVAPVLYSGTDAGHVLAQEEVFGPVQVVIPFVGEDEAVEIANATPYGLVAGIWTRDGARQLRVARQLHAGQVFINNYGAGGGVELPFGGTGLSGHGREKGFEALLGMTQTKTIAAYHG